jgi:hypothetical protein
MKSSDQRCLGRYVWPGLTGLTLIVGGKLGFLDRMVWLEANYRRSS